MVYSTTARRTIVLKARWDSILLVVAAGAVTFGLAATIHPRADEQSAMTQAEWTGDLADIESGPTPSPALPLTSASLVVPNSQLALPKVPVRTVVKFRGCSGSFCNARNTIQPVPRPALTPVAAIEHPIAPRDRPITTSGNRPSLLSRFNPLNHLPDISKINRPIDVAGDAVLGWFR